jgi:hypothetical protein
MSRLTSTDKALCAVYAVVGIAALVATQIALVRHISSGEGDGVGGLGNTVVNAAAAFVTIDLLAVAVVGLVFMVVEGRRLGMKWIWVYVVLTFAVAISVALPVFLIARQVHMADARQHTLATP